jgi:hypothetical protein
MSRAVSWSLFQAPKSLSTSQRFVLVALGWHATDEGGYAFPTVGRIAEMTGLNERSVRRCLVELVDAGVLEMTRESGRGKPNVYRFAVFNRVPFEPMIVSNRKVDIDDVSPRVKADIDDSSRPRKVDIGDSSRGDTLYKQNNTDTRAYWTDGRCAMFDDAFGLWPKRVNRDAARVAWQEVWTDDRYTDKQFITAFTQGAQRWIGYWREEGTTMQYMTAFDRWLKNEMWTIDPRGVIK